MKGGGVNVLWTVSVCVGNLPTCPGEVMKRQQLKIAGYVVLLVLGGLLPLVSQPNPSWLLLLPATYLLWRWG